MPARRRHPVPVRPAAVVALCGLAGLHGGCGGSAPRAGGPFVPDGPRSSAVVWAAGDGADGGPGAKAVAQLVARGKPDVFLYLGDVYPDGAPDSFAQSYAPTFGPLAGRTAPTPGNHDWPQHRQGYDPHWTKAHGTPPPPYYSFRAGGWQFLSLNSEVATGPGSAQQRWLRGQLRGAGDCRIAFWHRPRFSAGTVHGDNPGVDPLWRALLGRARLVLNGHEHDMQRMSPRRGIVELIDGAGGHSFYGLRRRYPGLRFSSPDEFGAIRMELRPGVARIAFVSIEGKQLDRTSVDCHPGRS
jgi:acid phosphatase type 7